MVSVTERWMKLYSIQLGIETRTKVICFLWVPLLDEPKKPSTFRMSCYGVALSKSCRFSNLKAFFSLRIGYAMAISRVFIISFIWSDSRTKKHLKIMMINNNLFYWFENKMTTWRRGHGSTVMLKIALNSAYTSFSLKKCAGMRRRNTRRDKTHDSIDPLIAFHRLESLGGSPNTFKMIMFECKFIPSVHCGPDVQFISWFLYSNRNKINIWNNFCILIRDFIISFLLSSLPTPANENWNQIMGQHN